MATYPKRPTFTNMSKTVLNAIRNQSTTNYQNYAPILTDDADSLRQLGAIIMDDSIIKNEFVNTLTNQIMTRVMVYKNFENPLKGVKRGYLELGEKIEEIFVELAKVFEYSPERAESTLYKRVLPNVKTAYHYMNYKKLYKVTISDADLAQAFTSWGAMDSFVANIIESIYQAVDYDEFQVMKYMIALQIINGRMYAETIPQLTAENMKPIVTKIKAISNDFTFRSPNYNIAKVRTLAKKDEQLMIVTTDFDATMDVEVLASAFNMDKVEFSGRKVMIDSFGKLDQDRLSEIFEDDDNYQPISEEQLVALRQIPCILIDKNWFMIYDNKFKGGNTWNEEGLYYNQVYHTWKTFGISPFGNNCLFVPSVPSITSVALSPLTANTVAGGSVYFKPTVVSENFAPTQVEWSITGNVSDKTKINETGTLDVGVDETATTITVKATSIFDGTKVGTATVTILSE